MKTSLAFAALALISGSAQAQNAFSFEINGRAVHIAIPRHCQDEQCLSISTSKAGSGTTRDGEQRFDTSKIVGVISDLMARRRETDDGAIDDTPPVRATPRAPTTEDAASAPVTAPAPSPKVEPVPAPIETTSLTPAIPTVQTPAPTTKATVTPPTEATARPSPVGIWLTQNKEAKVHIVACGRYYCGYAFDSRSARDGAQVLIDMKAVDSTQWHGSVHDPKGGGTYDATMALKSPDALAIRGCAFGGMICRGQTWSRV